MRDHSPNIMSEYLEIEDRIAEAMEWKSEHPNACPITELSLVSTSKSSTSGLLALGYYEHQASKQAKGP